MNAPATALPSTLKAKPVALAPGAQPWPGGDALGTAQAIARGELSATQALERAVSAVQQDNARLNAVCLLRPELAEPLARAVDQRLGACRSDVERHALLAAQPFLGVPLLLKDVGPATAHPQLPSRMGSRVFGPEGLSWPVLGSLTQRYLQAGCIPFGRSTSPEMGMNASTEARAYGGPTRNPWNTAHSSGGSSGGAGAAVAAGWVPLAHANDGAGSIRIPASACGLIGLKPSRGLMPLGPLVGEGWGGLALDHVLSVSTRDCAAMLDACAGADAGAPYAAPSAPAAGYAVHSAQAPRRLRIALCDHFYDGDPVHPEVAAVVRAFAEQLQRWGHEVEPATPPLQTLEVLRPVMEIIATGTATDLGKLAQSRGYPISDDELESITRSALAFGQNLKASTYLSAIGTLQLLARRMAQFHERYDLLLSPTLAEPPALLGRFVMDKADYLDYRLGPQGLWRYSPFCPLANATGAPAISLPAGLSGQGLPIGVMLMAPLGQDALLLQMAAQWELQRGGV